MVDDLSILPSPSPGSWGKNGAAAVRPTFVPLTWGASAGSQLGIGLPHEEYRGPDQHKYSMYSRSYIDNPIDSILIYMCLLSVRRDIIIFYILFNISPAKFQQGATFQLRISSNNYTALRLYLLRDLHSFSHAKGLVLS